MSAPARPVAAVESAHGGEILRRGRRGGALRPSDHRGPDARVSGRAGRGLRLGAGERAMIATGLAQGDSAALIARRIGRCRQTVSREIRRGAGADGVYRPAAAQAAARARLARPKIRRLDADPVLRERVVDPPGEPCPGTGRQTRSSPGDPRQRPDHSGGGVAAGSR